MDYIDPNKKRAYLIKLYIGYFLMAIAISLGALVLVFLSYGYDVSKKSGIIIQNGLVFVDSKPKPATVFVDGKEETKTDSKLVLPEGRHTFEMKKDGYRDWKRTINLEGASVERIIYPLLFPKDLVIKDLQIYSKQPFLVSQSLDRRWIIIKQTDSLNNFYLIDANNPLLSPKVVSLPDLAVTKAKTAESWEQIEWADDNRHALLKHNFDGKYEYIILDIEQPELSLNATNELKFSPYQLLFRDKKFNQLYSLDKPGGQLVSINTQSKTITGVVDKVLAFKSHGKDMVLFATPDANLPDKVKVKIIEESKAYDLRDLPISSKYLLDLAQYDGNWFVVAGSQTDNKVYVYKNPLNTLKQQNPRFLLPAFVLRINNPQFISFSSNAEFIALQNGSSFAIYDAHDDKQYRYNVPFTIATTEQAKWMDGHRLAIANQSKTNVWDFDSSNQQVLSPASNLSPIMFDRDYKILYNFAPSQKSPEQFAITVTSLLVTEPQNTN